VHGRPGGRGSAGRSAAGALRLAHTVGAALNNNRVLTGDGAGALIGGAILLSIFAAIAAFWPRVVAWPLAALALWIATGLLVRWRRMRRQREPETAAP